MPFGRERWSDGAPQKARRAEPMDEHDLLAAVPIALDVQRAGSGGNPKNVRFDGKARVGGWRAILRGDARQLMGEGQASQVTPLDPLSSAL